MPMPPIDALICRLIGCDLMQRSDEHEDGPNVVLAIVTSDDETTRCAISIDDARYLLRELSDVLQSLNAES